MKKVEQVLCLSQIQLLSASTRCLPLINISLIYFFLLLIVVHYMIKLIIKCIILFQTQNSHFSLWKYLILYNRNACILISSCDWLSLTCPALVLWNSSWCLSRSMLSTTPLRCHTSNRVFPCWYPTSWTQDQSDGPSSFTHFSHFKRKSNKNQEDDEKLTAISSNLPKSSVPYRSMGGRMYSQ